MVPHQLLGGRHEGSGSGTQRGPGADTEEVVAQIGHEEPKSNAGGVGHDPEVGVVEELALVVVEEAHPVGARDEEGEVDHAAVERDGAVVVAGDAELPEFRLDGEGVVVHERANVAEFEPDVAGQVLAAVVVGGVARISSLLVAGLNGQHLGDIERAIVGEVEMEFIPGFDAGV